MLLETHSVMPLEGSELPQFAISIWYSHSAFSTSNFCFAIMIDRSSLFEWCCDRAGRKGFGWVEPREDVVKGAWQGRWELKHPYFLEASAMLA